MSKYRLKKEYKTIAHNYDIGAEVAFVGGKYWIGFESFTEEQMNYLKGWVELIPEVSKESFTWTEKEIENILVSALNDREFGSYKTPHHYIEKSKQSKSPSIPVYTPNPDIMEYYKKHEKKFTQQNLDKAREQTWEAARLTHPLAGMKYPTLESYLQSLKQ